MELVDLKHALQENKPISLPLVFIGSLNDFTVKEYLYRISKILLLNIQEIKSINELQDITSSFLYKDDILFVFPIDKDTYIDNNALKNTNTILISEKEDYVKKCAFDSVKFFKLENWMVEEYCKVKLPGLSKQETDWLCKICKYDINRIDIEINKISIFDKKDQHRIFEEINNDNGYADLNDLTIFNLTNAITKKDILMIKEIMKEIEYIDIEATGLVTILIKQLYNIINIQMDKNATASSLNITDKQFKAIKYNCFKYDNNKLIGMFKFLLDVDYKIKSGLLDLSNKEAVEYIIENII